MRQLTWASGRSRRRRRRCYRWTAEEKARYLEAFRRSGTSVRAFCEAMDLSPITFAQWERAARPSRGKVGRASVTAAPTFARVEVTAAARPSAMTPGIRLVVRGAAGHEAALDGVDGPTAIQLVALVLEPPR